MKADGSSRPVRGRVVAAEAAEAMQARWARGELYSAG